MAQLSQAERIAQYYEQLSPAGREKFICSLDPWYWMTNYVWTHDPYQGVQRFPSFEYLKHAVHGLQDNRLNIFRKGRQMLFSWVFSAYGLWDAQFNYAASDLFTSKRLEDAFELKERAYFMWEHQPGWLRPPLTEDNKTTMSFKSMRSKIKFLPATDNVGRTFTAGHIFMDEFAHVTCNAGRMYVSIKPTINSGGRCTIFSSPNGPYGKFYDLCGAEASPDKGWDIPLDNGFHYYYMPYDVHPGHDAAWEAMAFQGLTPEEIDQEYRALWIKRGGRIFPLYGLAHYVDPFAIPPSWPKVRCIDFGGANPTACLWVAFSPTGQAVVYREYQRVALPVKTHAQNIISLSGSESYAFGTITDHESQTRIEYEENGISSQCAIKDWDSGYNEVTRHLMSDASGKPGLLVFKTCPIFHGQMMTYSYREVDTSKQNTPEEPLKLNDHLVDAARYILRTTKGRRTLFKPIRTIANRSLLDRIDESIVTPSKVERINHLLVPRFGITIGDIHSQSANYTYKRLNL